MFAVLMFGTWRMGIGEVVSLDGRGRGEGRRRSILRWESGVLGFCGWGVGEDMVLVVVLLMMMMMRTTRAGWGVWDKVLVVVVLLMMMKTSRAGWDLMGLTL